MTQRTGLNGSMMNASCRAPPLFVQNFFRGKQVVMPCVVRTLSDQQNIEGAKRGDSGCFERLYRSYFKRVYAVCDRIVRNNAIAEELTQDVFVQVLRKIDTFRGESQFYTWLHSIAVNAAVMYLRKHRLPMESLSDTSESGDPACAAVVDWDSRLLGTVDRLCIQRAIAGLPAGSRSVFILHDVQGYGHREISAMLGCSVGSTKAQLHRARVRLRSMLWKDSRSSGKPDDRTVATMSPRCGSRRDSSRRVRLGVSKTAVCGDTPYIEKSAVLYLVGE